ncbi:MAG TPA: FecR family protein [Chitinophagaceae bacterium]|jgi:ferric-dicitrate binding protein FerR (iron transport regulator)|nr:FecR family protein [Chitinophagaceae bacterium]
MSQEKFWVLLTKKLSGEASAEELKELENLITENPGWQYAIQNLGDLWNQQPPADHMQAEDAYMLHLHRMTEMSIPFGDSFPELPPVTARNSIRKWYWVAAAAVIITLGYLGFSKLLSKTGGEKPVTQKEVNEISTRKGSKSEIKLPDGSLVWLNAGSKLTYTKEYGQLNREVSLTGEGYFDVVKMKDKPFIIHTSNINIKVLGTVFNVKAYPEDKQTETSLIRGSIEVTINNRPSDKIILSPNEKLVVENEIFLKKEAEKYNLKYTPPTVSVNKLKYNQEDSTVVETQWVANKLVFNDLSFGEIVVMMERWYNVVIDLHDEVLEQTRMTGNFEKESIGQALEALKLTIPFRYDQTENKIIIHR